MNKSYKGKWKKDQQVTDEDRHLAMERALIVGQLLMDPSAFETLIDAINDKASPETARKNKLKVACMKVNLEQNQIDWLWNYLQHYDTNNNWTGTGW